MARRQHPHSRRESDYLLSHRIHTLPCVSPYLGLRPLRQKNRNRDKGPDETTSVTGKHVSTVRAPAMLDLSIALRKRDEDTCPV